MNLWPTVPADVSTELLVNPLTDRHTPVAPRIPTLICCLDAGMVDAMNEYATFCNLISDSKSRGSG